MKPAACLIASLLLAVPAAPAQSVVYFPDSLVGSPGGNYPWYTGNTLNPMRYQELVPGTFAGLPQKPMLLTKIGWALLNPTAANFATYTTFILRVGNAGVTALTNTWATNLPDQTIRFQRSNFVVSPGATAIWWELALDVPVLYDGKSGLVLDMITAVTPAATYCRVSRDSSIMRMLITSYTGGPTGGSPVTGGCKLMLTFAEAASPVLAANVDGNAATDLPFGSTAFVPGVLQQLHDDVSPAPFAVGSLAFRRDQGSLVPYSAYSQDVELLVSTSPLTADTMSTVFASNHGPDLLVVFPKGAVNWPASTAPAAGLPPFEYVLVFAKPFAWGGKGTLCWEARVTRDSRTAGSLAFDACNVLQPQAGPTRRVGQGCKAAGQSVPAWDDTYMNNIGLFQRKAGALAANAPALSWLGLSTTAWGTLPLPFDLAPLGAPGCSLDTNLLLSQAGVTAPDGSLGGGYIFPVNAAHVGLVLYNQTLCADAAANALGVVTTNASAATIPPLMPVKPTVSQVVSAGSLGSSGSLAKGLGLVVAFGS